MCPCCGVRCCLGENYTMGTQSQRQPSEKEKMSADEMKQQDSCVCHTRCERFSVGVLTLNVFQLIESTKDMSILDYLSTYLSIYSCICLLNTSGVTFNR